MLWRIWSFFSDECFLVFCFTFSIRSQLFNRWYGFSWEVSKHLTLLWWFPYQAYLFFVFLFVFFLYEFFIGTMWQFFFLLIYDGSIGFLLWIFDGLNATFSYRIAGRIMNKFSIGHRHESSNYIVSQAQPWFETVPWDIELCKVRVKSENSIKKNIPGTE